MYLGAFVDGAGRLVGVNRTGSDAIGLRMVLFLCTLDNLDKGILLAR